MTLWRPDDVVAVLEHAATFLQASVSGLKNDRLEGQGVVDDATVRDIVTHLAVWEAEFLSEARAMARVNHARFEYQAATSGAVGGCVLTAVAPPQACAWEQAQTAARQQMSTGAVFLELEQCQQQLLALARGLPARAWVHEAAWPWGQQGTLAELLVAASVHKRAHAESIRGWRTRGVF